MPYKDPEKRKAAIRNWQERNPESLKKSKAKYRAKHWERELSLQRDRRKKLFEKEAQELINQLLGREKP